MKFIRWFILIVVILVVLVVAFIQGALPLFIRGYLNRELPGWLDTEASVGIIRISPLTQSVVVRDIVVKQPAQFKGSPLVIIPRVYVKIALRSLLDRQVRLADVHITGPEIALVSSGDGTLNAGELGRSTAEGTSRDRTASPTGDEGRKQNREESHWSVWVEHLLIEHLAVTYADASTPSGEPLVSADHVSMRVADLFIGDTSAAPATQAYIDVKAQLVQDPSPPSHLILTADLGPIGFGMPMTQMKVFLDNILVDHFIRLPEGVQFAPQWQVPVDLVSEFHWGREQVRASLRIISENQAPLFECREFSYGLRNGVAEFDHLQIAQPSGFGDGEFLDIPKMQIQIDPATWSNAPITVTSVEIGSGTFALVRNTNGLLNTSSLFLNPETVVAAPTNTLADVALATNEHAEVKSFPPEENRTEASNPKAWQVSQIAISNLVFRLHDHSVGRMPVLLDIDEISLAASDIRVNMADVESPSPVRLTGRILQPYATNGMIGLAAEIGALGNTVPEANAQLRILGLSLSTLGTLLPPNTSRLLGANALDISVRLAMAPDLLNCRVNVTTPGRQSFTLNVGGTPHQPKFDKSGILFNILSRTTGGFGNVIRNVSGVGLAVTDTAYNTVNTVRKGATGVVSSVGQGVFNTVKGVVTADLKTVEKGVKEATLGTVGEAASTLQKTGGGLVSGADTARQASTGSLQDQRWMAKAGERWSEEWPKAQKEVAAMPFPPAEKKKKKPGALRRLF